MKLRDKIVEVSFAMDVLRLWPRIFVGAYLWELTRVVERYMNHPTPGWDLAAFVTAYSALCVPLLKWYMENGVDWDNMTDVCSRRGTHSVDSGVSGVDTPAR